jgi:pimeloyl-ACP methyl ester carboxylesterase
MHTFLSRCRAGLWLALILWASPAGATEFPVLFVHGFCSSADTWNETLPQLSTRRYGTDAPRVYESAIGKAAIKSPFVSGTKMFRQDFSDLANGFDLLAVANVPTVRKAGELKVVIDAIKYVTGAPKVILVAHSLGGLAARAYIQGIGRNRNDAVITYGRDVAALITISTPNQGSVLANLSGKPESAACTLADTANLRDLEPGSALLQELNQQSWPSGTPIHSIISNNVGQDSDDVVTVTSQDLTTIRRYESLPDARRWLQSFDRNGILHLRVHNEATTVALFTGIIGDLDNSPAQASAASPFSIQRITWRGVPLGGVQPTPSAPPQAPAGRACDGCPKRSVGRAFLDVTLVNAVYELANLARGQVTAHITPKTWWANMKQGWVWDLDDFGVNQIGHPYQGNNYYNAARAHGLSFWESAGMTAFGSGTWEYFGETNHASVNDLINTTLGGIALGEVLHRTAWLVRDTRASGRHRLTSEIAATAIDPVTGLLRFMNGDASRISDKPADMVPTALGGIFSAGVLWRGTDTRAFNATGQPFLEMDLLYGDPTTGRSRMPYDAFGVVLRLGGGGAISEAKAQGRLLGQPMKGDRIQVNVVQNYDFMKNDAYQYGAQSFTVNAAVKFRPSANLSFRVAGWGGLTALGAVDSIPLTGIAPETPPEDSKGQGVSEGPRYYDYGPGGMFGTRVVLARGGEPLVSFVYDARHLYSLDGVRANHFLQQLRLDLLVPVRGPFGLGVAGEYFDRRTYYKEAENETGKFKFPQLRAFLTWRMS